MKLTYKLEINKDAIKLNNSSAEELQKNIPHVVNNWRYISITGDAKTIFDTVSKINHSELNLRVNVVHLLYHKDAIFTILEDSLLTGDDYDTLINSNKQNSLFESIYKYR